VILPRAVLERIVSGEISLVFRRWVRPSVRAGGTLKTPLGVLAIEALERTEEASLTDEDALRAGHLDRRELLAELSRREGDLYRIVVRHAGDDPRVALRERAELSDAEVSGLRDRLARFDAASRSGAWTEAALRAIASRPAVLAAKLAKDVGLPTVVFKRNVRKLKELGLTESLEVGYRLSPRGWTLVERMGIEAQPTPALNALRRRSATGSRRLARRPLDTETPKTQRKAGLPKQGPGE
jgi:hypothetical protein